MITLIKNKSIREIASLTDWKKVKASMRFHYYGKWNSYEPVFKRLLTTKKKFVNPKEKLDVYAVNQDWGKPTEFDESYGIHINKTGQKMSWALTGQDWDKLINMKITDDTFEHYTVTDIVAHFIYELTWYGTEKMTKDFMKEVVSRAKKVKKHVTKNHKI